LIYEVDHIDFKDFRINGDHSEVMCDIETRNKTFEMHFKAFFVIV